MVQKLKTEIKTATNGLTDCKRQPKDNQLEMNKVQSQINLIESEIRRITKSEEQCKKDLKDQKAALTLVENQMNEQKTVMNHLKSEKEVAESQSSDCDRWVDFRDFMDFSIPQELRGRAWKHIFIFGHL